MVVDIKTEVQKFVYLFSQLFHCFAHLEQQNQRYPLKYYGTECCFKGLISMEKALSL